MTVMEIESNALLIGGKWVQPAQGASLPVVDPCNGEPFALEARDTGKPIGATRIDLQLTARYFEFYAGAADKVLGQDVPFLEGYTVNVLREPHGVTGHIIPWNYPASSYARTLAPALAVGNAAVVKPAEEACLSTLRLSELALEAGLPDGALNIVTGLGETAGAALAAHPGVAFLSFTGSPEVGTLIPIPAPAIRTCGVMCVEG